MTLSTSIEGQLASLKMLLAEKLTCMNNIFFNLRHVLNYNKKILQIHSSDNDFFFFAIATRVSFVRSLTYYPVQRVCGRLVVSRVSLKVELLIGRIPHSLKRSIDRVSLSNSSRQNFGLLVNFVFLKH